jgi:hypothetical protein
LTSVHCMLGSWKEDKDFVIIATGACIFICWLRLADIAFASFASFLFGGVTGAIASPRSLALAPGHHAPAFWRSC